MAKQYQVRVSNEFKAITGSNRLVGDLSVDQGGYTGELTDEQVKLVHADRYLSLYDEKGKPVEATEEASEPSEATEEASEPAPAPKKTSAPKKSAQDAPTPSTDTNSDLV